MKEAKPYWSVIAVLALVKFLLPLILQSSEFELQRDEYLYYQQGQHFALGYLENPPLLSWLGMISSWLGGSTFWIKFWPSLFGSLTLIVTCLLTAEFGGKRFAQLIAAMGIITGAFLRMHSLFQPNVLDIFFWTLAIYFLVRFVKTRRSDFLLAMVLTLAVGWWGKYSIAFLAIAILLSLLFSRYRSVFIQKRMYAALITGFIVILPNLWWQFDHRWPLVHHMKELQDTQLRYMNPLDFIKDQLLYLVPVVFVWIAGLVWLFKSRQWRFLGLTYLFVIVLLILGRGKSYYSMGIYPLLLAAGGTALQNATKRKIALRPVICLLILLLTLPFVPLLLPIWKPAKLATFYRKTKIEKTGLLKWEDQRDHSLPQDFADMLGWKELAQKAERLYASLPHSAKAMTVIYCRSYGQAGALKFYGKEKDFRQRVISDNGSFLLWIPKLSFSHLIFIGRNIPGKDDEVFQHFASFKVIDSVTNIYSRQLGDKIILYSNADSVANTLAMDGLNEMKGEFQR